MCDKLINFIANMTPGLTYGIIQEDGKLRLIKIDSEHPIGHLASVCKREYLMNVLIDTTRTITDTTLAKELLSHLHGTRNELIDALEKALVATNRMYGETLSNDDLKIWVKVTRETNRRETQQEEPVVKKHRRKTRNNSMDQTTTFEPDQSTLGHWSLV